MDTVIENIYSVEILAAMSLLKQSVLAWIFLINDTKLLEELFL